MLPMDRIRIKLEMQVLGIVSRAQTQRKLIRETRDGVFGFKAGEGGKKTYKLPSRKTPLTSNFFRVERFKSQIMGNGTQRMITSRSRLDTVIPNRNA